MLYSLDDKINDTFGNWDSFSISPSPSITNGFPSTEEVGANMESVQSGSRRNTEVE